MSRQKSFTLLTPAILLLAGLAFSQVALNTGSIYGKVLDSTGAPMPGVTITLEGEGTLAKTAYSGEAGLYRFAGLAPGMYTVRVSLQGFTEVRQENVRVMTGHTVELEVVLQQSMTEELTILGESPLVDTRKTSTSTSFNQEYLQSVPTTRDPWSVLDQVPGVDENRINVGGTSSGQQPTFAARGAARFSKTSTATTASISLRQAEERPVISITDHLKRSRSRPEASILQ